MKIIQADRRNDQFIKIDFKFVSLKQYSEAF